MKASNLEKRDFNLPADFEGDRNLLLVAFEREQQKDAARHLRLARDEVDSMKRGPGFHYSEHGAANSKAWRFHALSSYREAWHRHGIATNLKSAFAVVRAAALTMAQQGGSVVLLSTAAARIGLANHEAISAAKAGIEGLALAASASYAAKGIRVNCVAPGMTRTPLTAKLLKNEMMAKASAGMHALGGSVSQTRLLPRSSGYSIPSRAGLPVR